MRIFDTNYDFEYD